MNRSGFLLSSGAGLATAGASGGNAFATTNIILPGRGGTAFYENLPLWTPKAALSHPLTAELNRVPRFNSATRRLIKNIDRAMNSRTIPRFDSLNPLKSTCGGRCGGGGVHQFATNSQHLSAPVLAYTGQKIIATKALQAVDGYGAQMNGYGVSGSQYVINSYGQSQTVVNQSSLTAWGQGVFQIGTTTITQHPTLPMARWHDPVFGSGVAYYDAPSSSINVAMSNDAATTDPRNRSYRQATAYPSPTFGIWNKIDIGLSVGGVVLGIAGLAALGATAGVIGVVGMAVGVAIGVLAIAASIFSLIRSLMGTTDQASLGSTQIISGGDGAPDGLDANGYLNGGYPDGGGGGGTDAPLVM